MYWPEAHWKRHKDKQKIAPGSCVKVIQLRVLTRKSNIRKLQEEELNILKELQSDLQRDRYSVFLAVVAIYSHISTCYKFNQVTSNYYHAHKLLKVCWR